MSLYIQIENGQPINHPIMHANLTHAMPYIDTNNLPSNFAIFHRTPPPHYGKFQILLDSIYKLQDDGTVLETWEIRDMTPDEISDMHQQEKDRWVSIGRNKTWPSWKFNEELCMFTAPTPKPDEYQPWVWNESIVDWEIWTAPIEIIETVDNNAGTVTEEVATLLVDTGLLDESTITPAPKNRTSTK